MELLFGLNTTQQNYPKKWKKNAQFWNLQARITFYLKLCFLAKSHEQIEFVVLDFLDFLCLDPSILIKIAIL